MNELFIKALKLGGKTLFYNISSQIFPNFE